MNGDTKARARRRIFLIDREFQYWYMTSWILMTLAFIGVSALILAWARQAAPKVSGSLLNEVSFLLNQAWYLVVLLTIFMGCAFLVMAHRIAGPAYRIRKCLERVSRGDYDFTVTLRKRDYLKDVADGVNATLRRLRERQARVLAAQELWRKVADMAASSPEGQKIAAELEAALAEALRVEPPGEETKAVLVPEPEAPADH